MSREPLWRRYLRFWGPDAEADIRDELSFHLEAKVDELIAAGMQPADARLEAERQFGPIQPIHRELYRISKRRQDRATLLDYFGGWLRDFRYTFRILRKHSASTVVALLILTFGIGATTSVFTALSS